MYMYITAAELKKEEQHECTVAAHSELILGTGVYDH